MVRYLGLGNEQNTPFNSLFLFHDRQDFLASQSDLSPSGNHSFQFAFPKQVPSFHANLESNDVYVKGTSSFAARPDTMIRSSTAAEALDLELPFAEVQVCNKKPCKSFSRVSQGYGCCF